MCGMKNLFKNLGYQKLKQNPEQAYLCFENALYYSDDPVEQDTFRTLLSDLSDDGHAVPPVSIVICSYNSSEDMLRCLESIRSTTSAEMREIIVIDNASSDGITEKLQSEPNIILQCNDENAGFPTACNQGIRLASPENDIFLLNNDTLLMENSLFWLRMALYEDSTVGATGSMSNQAANGQQIEHPDRPLSDFYAYAHEHNIPMETPYVEKLRLIGFAMLIKRTVLDNIGLLDESFSPGNYEDDDLSIRILLAGFHLLLCKNSFIYHVGGRNFKKNQTSYRELLARNQRKFKEKWGFHLEFAAGIREDFFSVLPQDQTSSFCVVEIECEAGADLKEIQRLYPNAKVFGTSSDPVRAQIAALFTGAVRPPEELPAHTFDIVLLAALPVTSTLDSTLAWVEALLKPGGKVLAMLPNAFFLPRLISDDKSPAYLRESLLRSFAIHHLQPTALNGISKDELLPENHVELSQTICAAKPELEKNELYTWQFLLEAVRQE